MSIKKRIDRLAIGLIPEPVGVILPGGQVVKLPIGEVMDCLSDAIHGRENQHMATIRQAVGETGGGSIIQLVQVLDKSRREWPGRPQ